MTHFVKTVGDGSGGDMNATPGTGIPASRGCNGFDGGIETV